MAESTDPQNDARVASFLEFVKWHHDNVQVAFGSLGQSSLTLLGFNGVVLAIGAQGSRSYDPAIQVFVVFGTIALIVSMVFCLLGLTPRTVSVISLEHLESELRKYVADRYSKYPAQGLEHLLHVLNESEGDSPIRSLEQSTRQRGRSVQIAGILSTTGAAFFGLSLILQITH